MCGWEFMEVESNVSGLAFAAEWLQEKKGKNFTANETSYNMNYNNQVLRFSTRLFPLQTSLNFWDRRRETRITGLPSRKNLPSQEAKSFYVPPFFSTTRWEIQKTLHLTTSKELASWPGRFFLVYQQICSQKKRLNLWFQLYFGVDMRWLLPFLFAKVIRKTEENVARMFKLGWRQGIGFQLRHFSSLWGVI